MPIYCIKTKSTEFIGLVFPFCKFFAIPKQFLKSSGENCGGVSRQKNSITFGMWHLGPNTQLLRPQAIWNSHFSKKSIHPIGGAILNYSSILKFCKKKSYFYNIFFMNWCFQIQSFKRFRWILSELCIICVWRPYWFLCHFEMLFLKLPTLDYQNMS
jgi:hypothetical protein